MILNSSESFRSKSEDDEYRNFRFIRKDPSFGKCGKRYLSEKNIQFGNLKKITVSVKYLYKVVCECGVSRKSGIYAIRYHDTVLVQWRSYHFEPLLPCFVTKNKRVLGFSRLWCGTSWDSLSSTMGRSNATPARCIIAGLNTLHTPILGSCYITEDSATTALQNGACTMHISVHFQT